MKAVTVLILSAVLLGFSACQKSNQEQATVPTVTTDCLNNPNLCNSGVYNQSQGFTPYNYNGYNGYNGFYGGGYYGGYQYQYGYNPFLSGSGSLCSCPAGTMPTYNNYAGLGCVQSSFVYGYAYVSFGYGANNNQWVNLQQISNIAGYGYNPTQSSCYNTVVQSCLVGDSTACGSGYSCRINSASARLGICVSTSTGLSRF